MNDVQVNAYNATICIYDRTDGNNNIIEVDFGAGQTRLMLSLSKASELQELLRTEVTRQRSVLAGRAAKRLLAHKQWVNGIYVKPFENGVVLFIISDEERNLAISREVITFGHLLTQAVGAMVTTHLFNSTVVEDGFVEVYKREPPAAAC